MQNLGHWCTKWEAGNTKGHENSQLGLSSPGTATHKELTSYISLRHSHTAAQLGPQSASTLILDAEISSRWFARGSKLGGRGGCLLYTSDAADDM
eukprot:3814802-Rhodomonas_salina.1